MKNCKSIFGYSPRYAFLHPWKIIEFCIDEIKYAWQRVFRGWDNRAVWSIDYWLAEIMPEILTRLKENNHGTPVEFLDGMEEVEDDRGWITYRPEDEKKANDAWNAEIDKMIDGFLSAKAIGDWEFKTEEERLMLEKVFNIGMDSFKKHFFSLWD